MTAVISASVFLLLATGTWLVLQRRLLWVAIGLSLLSHGTHLLLLSAGRWGARAPIMVEGVPAAAMADPLPQAFALTAIVISMAVTLYLLTAMAALGRRGLKTEVEVPPQGDAGRSRESVRAELEGAGADA